MANASKDTSRTPVDLLTLSETQAWTLNEIADHGGFVPLPKSALPVGVAKSTLNAVITRGLIGTAVYRALPESKAPSRLREVQLYWVTNRGEQAAYIHA